MENNNINKGGFEKVTLSLISVLIIAVLLGFLFQGCSDSSNAVSTNADNIGFSVKLTDAPLNNPQSAIQISEAKALVSELEIETSDGTESQELHLSPFVIHFDLTGSIKEILSAYIPSKTYKKVKFQIHKPEDSETPPDPEFKDATGRYSFIIRGTYNGNSFVFKSKKTVNIVLNMNNAVNISLPKMNITMILNKLQWFLENGNEIDPRDASKEDIIDDNLRNSFKNVFKDDDHNGLPDDN